MKEYKYQTLVVETGRFLPKTLVYRLAAFPSKSARIKTVGR